ncbi:MAG: hypothetical protein ABIH37_04260 [archaeon]
MKNPEYQATQVGEVKDLGMVYQVNFSLSDSITALANEGIIHPYLVTPEETARIRLAGVSNDWTRTCISPVAVKGENTILSKPSVFMDANLAVIAETAHKNGQYPTLPREFYEALKQQAITQESLEPEDRTVHALSINGDYDLTPEMDDARFILGKTTQEYFKRFNHKQIKLYDLSADDLSEDKCAVNYLWFYGPEGDSDLGCRYRLLHDLNGAFGVLKQSAEGALQNSGYTLSKVSDAVSQALPDVLTEVGLPAGIDLVGNTLEKRVLEKLRKQ